MDSLWKDAATPLCAVVPLGCCDPYVTRLAAALTISPPAFASEMSRPAVNVLMHVCCRPNRKES
ncbi:hypothetical protein PUNSTDRAFT_49955 [Punctularia strigosozonata HHB-11173 SS5]|uniref:uncharacterized protein n=1 Tax=Punctularia strigosozonata (strain HHB-11173) TaxID=741275 RepID=UPI0004416B0C|nr:uncharacterized protein PUNSTDRAFT_49955 [Punctularia strigosozonata HHB-11173 SS5]EIN12684.1 hypothetical protein PUNSTDRAFT_49955 [Punctularia strigosozonata HHB-11173 SS5]